MTINLGGGAAILSAILVVLCFVVGAGLRKMIGDEFRARCDDVPEWILGRALKRLPEDVRESYRVDWESNLLAVLNDSTTRYPVARVLKSVRFAFALATSVRALTAALNDIEDPMGYGRIRKHASMCGLFAADMMTFLGLCMENDALKAVSTSESTLKGAVVNQHELLASALPATEKQLIE